jgi:imidazolonepropionase-like amidohydrolase
MCLAFVWNVGCAQEPSTGDVTPSLTGQATPAEGLVIINARIIDGTGGVIERGTVVVRDGRIVSVSASAETVPGALVVDAEGLTVMPGFIDAHRHVMGGDAQQWLDEQAAARMQEFLDAGFTTVLSAGDSLDGVIELRRRLEAGEITGPRLLASGRAPVARPAGGARGGRGGGRGGDPARTDVARPPLRPTEPATAVPADETRATVQMLADAGVDAVKTNITVTPGGPEQQTLRLIAEEGRRLGIPTITHAVTVQDTIAAVEAGVDVLVHTPHIGQLTEEQAQMIAAAGIPMMSTLSVFVPVFDENNEPLFRDLEPFPMATLSSAGQGPVNARLLWEAGVTYGYGTDTRYLPKDSLAAELRPLTLVFSPKDIVTIMTRNAATTVGLADEIGTLEAGKLADIVILDGDPLADIYDVLNVAIVIKSGNVVVDDR